MVMDTLSAMKVFCSVVENDSLAAAARLLNVSPSVVSKQLSALEDRLGVRLLNRTTRRVSVTEEGQAYYERSKRIITDVDEALKHVPMVGIRTAKVDKGYSGSKFLEFEVTGACVIFLCWDITCHSSPLPRWVSRKGFQLSQFRISTTESKYLVYTKRLYGASTQALGGCV